MTTEKEKALLDYLFEHAKVIRQFMRENGYGSEYGLVTMTVGIDRKIKTFGNGTQLYDVMATDFSQYYESGCSKRSVEKRYNTLNNTTRYQEFQWKDEKGKGEA